MKKSTLVPNLFQEKNYFRNGNFIHFLDQKILLWDNDFEKPTTAFYFDYIVVSDKVDLDFKNIKCKQVIIDSSVPKYKWEQIKKECLEWDIPFYNVST